MSPELQIKDHVSDTVNNRYSCSAACKAWHGSLNPLDSYVPLIMSYPGGNKKALEEIINSTADCSVSTGCEGNWKVRDLIKEYCRKTIWHTITEKLL